MATPKFLASFLACLMGINPENFSDDPIRNIFPRRIWCEDVKICVFVFRTPQFCATLPPIKNLTPGLQEEFEYHSVRFSYWYKQNGKERSWARLYLQLIFIEMNNPMPVFEISGWQINSFQFMILSALLTAGKCCEEVVNQLRHANTFEHYAARTEKFKNSLTPYCVNNYQ